MALSRRQRVFRGTLVGLIAIWLSGQVLLHQLEVSSSSSSSSSSSTLSETPNPYESSMTRVSADAAIAASNKNHADIHNDDDDDEDVCLTDACIQELAATIARVWTPKPLSNWCPNQTASFEHAHDAPHPSGLLLVKVPKSASSTAAGLVLRLQDLYDCPVVEWQHRAAVAYAGRVPAHSFLLAPIRQTHLRALSSVYFHKVSLQQGTSSGQQTLRQPSNAFVLQQLQQLDANYILHYTTLQAFAQTPVSNQASLVDMVHRVEQVVQNYDFLLVVERWEESMVVLAWLTGVKLTDLLTLSSKRAGSWYQSGGQCTSLVPPVVTEALEAYWSSKDWKRHNAGDLILQAAANQSLDKTIEQIGRDVVQQGVSQWRQWQDVIQEACLARAAFPCSANGTLQLEASQQSCYLRDFGCGHDCIDEQVAKFADNE